MLAAAALLLLAGAAPGSPPATTGAPPSAADHARAAEEWRKGRLQRLTSDEGWLTVAGLFWLKEGANPFGGARDNAVRLPASAPARVGVFHLAKGTVTVEIPAGGAVTLAGQPFSGKRELRG